jgi:uncharacterized protein (DUF58 family)
MLSENRPAFTQLQKLRHLAQQESAALPALIAEAEKAAISILTGEHAQAKPGTGEKFWQFREYDPSDRPQDIDWRMSARTDRLFVRQKEWQTTQSTLFWLAHNKNTNFKSSKNLPSKFESSMVLSLGMALLVTHAHERIGLLSGTMRQGRSEQSVQTLGLELLKEKTGALPDIDIEKIAPHAGIILAGDFLCTPEELDRALSSLSTRTQNGLVFQVLDPAELTLPYDGRVIFETQSQKENYHIQNVGSVRIPYIEKINAHIESVRQICKKHGWHWLLHQTDAPPRDTLFDAFMMTARTADTGAPR